jgi:hypothetical protein
MNQGEKKGLRLLMLARRHILIFFFANRKPATERRRRLDSKSSSFFEEVVVIRVLQEKECCCLMSGSVREGILCLLWLLVYGTLLLCSAAATPGVGTRQQSLVRVGSGFRGGGDWIGLSTSKKIREGSASRSPTF